MEHKTNILTRMTYLQRILPFAIFLFHGRVSETIIIYLFIIYYYYQRHAVISKLCYAIHNNGSINNNIRLNNIYAAQ